MAAKKTLIGGEELSNPYPLRTTDFIINQFTVEATMKGVSMNMLFNKALLPVAKKYKAKSTNHKK